MFDTLQAGDTITCTISKSPRRDDQAQTIARLMRLDPDVKRALKKGQEHRMRNLNVRTRGGRPWAVRVRPAKVAVPVQGAEFTVRWIPHVRADFESVADLLDVKKAG